VVFPNYKKKLLPAGRDQILDQSADRAAARRGEIEGPALEFESEVEGEGLRVVPPHCTAPLGGCQPGFRRLADCHLEWPFFGGVIS
jgi:hypothetical protein